MDGFQVEGSDGTEFVSLHDARALGVSVGTLATAIQRHGIFGWDRYNRLVHSDQENRLSERALDALADAVDAGDGSLSDGAIEPRPEDSPWLNCGWPADECPNFQSIAAGQRERRAPAEPRRLAGHLLLIDAQRELLRSIRGPSGQPYFRSNAQIIERILESRGDVWGGGETTIQKLFADARKLAAERLNQGAEQVDLDE